MNKEEFRQALRDKLANVPLESRKKWDDTKLFGWWLVAASESRRFLPDMGARKRRRMAARERNVQRPHRPDGEQVNCST